MKYCSIFQHVFVFHKESISGFHDFKPKKCHKTNSWSEWGKKFADKMTGNCKYSHLQSNNSKIIQLVNMFFFLKKHWLMILNINKVWELSAGVSKAKISLKYINTIHSYLNFQNYYICEHTCYTRPTLFQSKIW